jgi:hypothetical protein
MICPEFLRFMNFDIQNSVIFKVLSFFVMQVTFGRRRNIAESDEICF